MTGASTLSTRWSAISTSTTTSAWPKNERADLVAYLDAVGDAEQPYTRNTVQAEVDELQAFASVLDTAIPAHDREVIALTVEFGRRRMA